MNTIATLAELVEQLAVRTLGPNGEQGDSLLRQLADARYPTIGHSSGSSTAASEHIGFDDIAHTLLEDISGRIESMLVDWARQRPIHDPATDLKTWWASYSAAFDRGEVEPHHERAAHAWLSEWAESITTHLTPAITHLLRGYACPECHTARVTQGVGILTTETDALSVIIVRGQELAAECDHCGAFWSGTAAVIDLAKRVGAKPDPKGIRDALQEARRTEDVDNHMDASA